MNSETMLDAPLKDVGTWLFLMAFCIGQENGGRIANCRAWADSKWQRMVCVSAEDVADNSSLWLWDGDDLEVEFYPMQKQLQVQSGRTTGSAGGKKRALNAARKTLQGPPSTPPVQRKGREGNGKESNGREEHAPEVNIPTVWDVRAKAALRGIDPDYYEKKWRETEGVHGWERNGRLIDWDLLWSSYWTQDAPRWMAGKKNGNGPTAGRTPAQARFELSRQLDEVAERVDAAYDGAMEPDPKDVVMEKKLRAELAALAT